MIRREDYPFYCIGKIDRGDHAVIFTTNQPDLNPYGWVNDNRLNYYFLEYKMHVFTTIINKGFEI